MLNCDKFNMPASTCYTSFTCQVRDLLLMRMTSAEPPRGGSAALGYKTNGARYSGQSDQHRTRNTVISANFVC